MTRNKAAVKPWRISHIKGQYDFFLVDQLNKKYISRTEMMSSMNVFHYELTIWKKVLIRKQSQTKKTYSFWYLCLVINKYLVIYQQIYKSAILSSFLIYYTEIFKHADKYSDVVWIQSVNNSF